MKARPGGACGRRPGRACDCACWRYLLTHPIMSTQADIVNTVVSTSDCPLCEARRFAKGPAALAHAAGSKRLGRGPPSRGNGGPGEPTVSPVKPGPPLSSTGREQAQPCRRTGRFCARSTPCGPQRPFCTWGPNSPPLLPTPRGPHHVGRIGTLPAPACPFCALYLLDHRRCLPMARAVCKPAAMARKPKQPRPRSTTPRRMTLLLLRAAASVGTSLLPPALALAAPLLSPTASLLPARAGGRRRLRLGIRHR